MLQTQPYTDHQIASYNLVRELYKSADGTPIELTSGQIELFSAIFYREYKRLHVMTPTRYGKSQTIALAVLTRAIKYPEQWAILGPNKEKAQIIMDYLIQHIFDNPLSRSRFVMEEGDSEDYIRRYRNKKKITFRIPVKGKKGQYVYSTVYVQSAKEALGFGSPNVIEDEAALINDHEHSFVMRMLGDQKDNFLCKIGNPFTRGHFLRSFRDPLYKKFVVSWLQGVQEGRYTTSYIDEMRQQPNFGPLYGNEQGPQFPDAVSQDDKGYNALISEPLLDRAYVNEMPFIGEKFMGIDLADGGENFSTITVRGANVAKLYYRQRTADPLVVISKAVEIAKAERIPFDDKHIFPDKTGNVAWCARLNELYPLSPQDGHQNNFGIHAGEKPEPDDEPTELLIDEKTGNHESIYYNRKAQMNLRCAHWLETGGKLVGKPFYDEGLVQRWKLRTDKKIIMKGKKELAEEGIPSPDVWDSFALTFARRPKGLSRGHKQHDVEIDRHGLI